jgi:hypothetical protein
MSRLAFDGQLSTEPPDAFFHTQDAQTGGSCGNRFPGMGIFAKSYAIVLQQKSETGCFEVQFNLKSTRLRMFERVGQRFLGDPHQGLFPGRTDPKRPASHTDFRLQLRGGCTFLDDLLQRVHERGRLRQNTRPQSFQCASGLQQGLACQSPPTL